MAFALAAGSRSQRSADLRICGESSRFGAPIKNLGLVMAYAEMAPLVRLVGPAVALEILLEGRIFDAAEAKEKGLVTRVVPDDHVAAEARAAAQRIADGAPLGCTLAQEVRAASGRAHAADCRKSSMNVSIASTPRTFGSATRHSSRSKSPIS